MSIASRLRETVTRLALGPERAALVEALTTSDLATLVLAAEDVGWQRIGGPTTGGNTDFSEPDRIAMVKKARLYYYRDPMVRQAVRLYTTYALGQGIQVRHKDPTAQAVIDCFQKDKLNRRILGPLGLYKLSDQLLVDGEAFLAVITANLSRPQVRPIDPLEITEIITNPDDAVDIWYYRRTTPGAAGQPRDRYYAAADAEWGGATEAVARARLGDTRARAIGAGLQPDVTLVHVACNTLGQRGYTLLSAVLDWAKANRQFQEDRATITKAAAQFAFKKKVKGSPAQVAALAGAQRTGGAAPGGVGDPGYNLRGPVSGATHVANEQVEFEQFKFDTGAGNAKEDARLLKLQFLAGVGFAEHYFGDSDSGTLATATAMERPIELNLIAYQLVICTLHELVYGEVLDATGQPEEGLSVLTPPILNIDVPALLTAVKDVLGVIPELNQEFLWRKVLTLLGVDDVDAAIRAIHAALAPPAAPPPTPAVTLPTTPPGDPTL